jgi:hypothetical protein
MPFPRVRRWALGVGFVLTVIGCSERIGAPPAPVVCEDRTITFDSSGGAAFQHGQNGVFVTDPTTGAPKRIYEPTPDDIAVGPPAWEPGGKRMVFTVARSLDGTRFQPLTDGPADGRRYLKIPIRYACWLYDPAVYEIPEKLFETTAGHAGYVAAGLAVCWHPDGKRLDFIERGGAQRHRVRTFDTATNQITDVPLSGENIVLGSAPNRPTRYALLGGGEVDGLFVEGAGSKWWRVPLSGPSSADLEELRQRLPCWSRDGKKLAFTDGGALRVCDITKRTTETWSHSAPTRSSRPELFPLPPVTLHWHPDGARIGLLDDARLGLVNSKGWQKALCEAPVISFAGWNATGSRMAYVTTDPLPYGAGARWATLFVPNVNARTAVRAADTDGANETVLVPGLRATFPHWAPDESESRLSVWLTVEPPYQLLDSGQLGMRPGDPAALIDPETGTLEWLPVNGTEHAQIGHVELRTGQLDAALHRFDRASAALPADAKADWMAFYAIALQKAGRAEDAREAWKRFEPTRAGDTGVILPRHRFIAEAFISLEMVDEGIAHLSAEMTATTSAAEHLSVTLALCQMLLLADRKAEFAECVTEHLLALDGRVLRSANAGPEGAAVAWTLLPLAAREFTAELPKAAIQRVSERVAAAVARTEDVDFVCQLVLRECGRSLKDQKLAERARARLANHPARTRWNLTNGEVDADALARVQRAALDARRAP